MSDKNFSKALILALAAWVLFYYLFPVPFLPDDSYILRVVAGQVYSRTIFLVFLIGLFYLWLSMKQLKGLLRVNYLLGCEDLLCLEKSTLTPPLDTMIKAFLHFSRRAKARQEMVSMTEAYLRSFREWLEEKFSPVKVIIWALPLMGFIGTVVGVSMAIAGFKVSGEGTSSFVQSFSQVTQGLYTAFDTTFLGLVLVLVLMFLYSAAWKRISVSINALEGFLLEKIIPEMEFPEEAPGFSLDLSRWEERMNSVIEKMEEGARILAAISKALLLSLGEVEKERILDETERGKL